jgi:hypothetical protein
VTVIPVGFGEKEENDRIPSRKLKSSLKSPVPYHKQNKVIPEMCRAY